MSETTKRQVSQLGHLQRAEYLRETVRDGGDFGVVEKPLTVFEKIYNQAWARKLLIVTLLALAWQGYASCMNVIDFTGQVKVPTNLSASLPIGLNWVAAFGIGLVNWLLWLGEVALTLPWIVYKGAMTISGGKCEPRPLLVPLFTVTLGALWDALISGELIFKGANTVRLLLQGYGTGLLLAAIMTTLAILTTIGNDFLETMTAMLNPLPAIALLPLALIWFGLGDKSIIFVLVHSVLWAVALNTHSGFKSVSNTMRMVGRNYGLVGIPYVCKILIPAAFPSILTGLKIGWAFAWRTLIAAELVFGASSGQGGLGWFIYESKNQLEIPSVYAGLLMVIIIGLLVENLIFKKIEAATVRKWGHAELTTADREFVIECVNSHASSASTSATYPQLSVAFPRPIRLDR